MAEHFDELQCGPRSMLLLAAKAGRPINPEQLWHRFSPEFGHNKDLPGASYVSLLLDIARAYGLAQHLDVTHDIDRVARALGMPNVAGVLLAWERIPKATTPGQFVAHSHIAFVHQILVDPQNRRWIDVESPMKGQQSERIPLAAELIAPMMASFLVFAN